MGSTEQQVATPSRDHAPPETNGMAIASLACGIVGLIAVPLITSILAVVFGQMAKSQIDSSGGRQGGRGMAQAGVVLGWIGIALVAVLGLFVGSMIF